MVGTGGGGKRREFLLFPGPIRVRHPSVVIAEDLEERMPRERLLENPLVEGNRLGFRAGEHAVIRHPPAIPEQVPVGEPREHAQDKEGPGVLEPGGHSPRLTPSDLGCQGRLMFGRLEELATRFSYGYGYRLPSQKLGFFAYSCRTTNS